MHKHQSMFTRQLMSIQKLIQSCKLFLKLSTVIVSYQRLLSLNSNASGQNFSFSHFLLLLYLAAADIPYRGHAFILQMLLFCLIELKISDCNVALQYSPTLLVASNIPYTTLCVFLPIRILFPIQLSSPLTLCCVVLHIHCQQSSDIQQQGAERFH